MAGCCPQLLQTALPNIEHMEWIKHPSVSALQAFILQAFPVPHALVTGPNAEIHG